VRSSNEWRIIGLCWSKKHQFCNRSIGSIQSILLHNRKAYSQSGQITLHFV